MVDLLFIFIASVRKDKFRFMGMRTNAQRGESSERCY